MIKTRKTHTVLRLLSIFLLFSLLFAAGCKKGSDSPKTPGLSLIEGVPIYDEGVALRTDHVTVSAGMMAFFFYRYGGAEMAEMEKITTYDAQRSLHEQEFQNGISFYDAIMNATLQKVSELVIYCEAAHAAGFTLNDTQRAAIEQELVQMAMDAAADHSMTLEAYLQHEYGPLMTEADMRAVLECEMLASLYSVTVNRTLEEGITDEQIARCVRERGFDDETPSRNVAYLSIPFVDGKANEKAVARARAALYETPAPSTLEALGELGTFRHERDLTPQNTTVKALADWLFHADRALLDRGEVEAGGATYILLYTGNGASYGEVLAKMHLYDEAFAAWYQGWVEALTFGYNYDVLDSYDVS